VQPRLSLTGRIASYSFRHKWYVLAAWVLLVVMSAAASAGIADVLTTEQKDFSGSESATAKQLIDDRYGDRPLVETLVIRHEALTADSPEFQSFVAQTAARLKDTKGVTDVQTYLTTGDPSMVSQDRHAALANVTLSSDNKVAEKDVEGVLAVVESAGGPSGYALHMVGASSANKEWSEIAEKDLSAAETIGLPVALIVIVLAFGAVVAAGVPLVLAAFAILPAIGTVALIGRGFELSFFVTNIITMIGLAVGIDYSLFIIGRYREELAKGYDRLTALGIAADSSGRAVFFSGITVLLALAGMLLVRTSIFMSIGIGAMVVVLYAIAASLTLLPAVLGILGRRIEWLRVPFLGKAGYGMKFWTGVTHIVQRRPVVFTVVSAGLLIAATLPLVTIDLGNNGVDTLPKNTSLYQGIKSLERDFNAGRFSPVQVVVDGPIGGPETQAAIARLRESIQARPELQWLGVTPDAKGNTAIIEIAAPNLGTTPAAIAMMDDLRDNVVPAAFAGTSAQAYVGGELPSYIDAKAEMDSRLPVVFGFVLGLSFLLLLLVFRSIAIPTKAILMNLLSVGAAYGLVVLVFQHGFLASQLGFTQVDQIAFWLPLFLFSILFGLSMDYHVFLLSRVKEEYGRTGDNKLAVATGVTRTAGMITSAAVIMVAVFASFAMGSLADMQQMGFGLAVAVFLDATIVRSVLVPASMQLLGKWNWWFPSWLEWLPTVNVEGSHHDAPVAIPAGVEVAGAAGD
jgi:putative drug exporter of the RND superfamily